MTEREKLLLGISIGVGSLCGVLIIVIVLLILKVQRVDRFIPPGMKILKGDTFLVTVDYYTFRGVLMALIRTVV